jgi:hypothetical protein
MAPGQDSRRQVSRHDAEDQCANEYKGRTDEKDIQLLCSFHFRLQFLAIGTAMTPMLGRNDVASIHKCRRTPCTMPDPYQNTNATF